MSPEAGPLRHVRAIPTHRRVRWLARLVLLLLLVVLLLLLLLQPWRGAREGQGRFLAGICRTFMALYTPPASGSAPKSLA